MKLSHGLLQGSLCESVGGVSWVEEGFVCRLAVGPLHCYWPRQSG